MYVHIYSYIYDYGLRFCQLLIRMVTQRLFLRYQRSYKVLLLLSAHGSSLLFLLSYNPWLSGKFVLFSPLNAVLPCSGQENYRRRIKLPMPYKGNGGSCSR